MCTHQLSETPIGASGKCQNQRAISRSSPTTTTMSQLLATDGVPSNPRIAFEALIVPQLLITSTNNRSQRARLVQLELRCETY
ncbi:hypothetical protein M413DRAFT_448980 [Hebeloma cylindrosporum]|uniref:Uncharacterized protein n=1 Tax=Hebeloma cylindrosporum TaxID=76867 RepID=A0A0C2XFE1_HEBCY|nr:hypothetical protein M413DRAFT_448980 [Hebeloma cylindrosporum h7]